MNTPYAKGPWKINEATLDESIRGHVCIDSPDHGALAQVVWLMDDDRGATDDLGGSDRCRANAYLIAAAPDLLKALQAAIECGMVPLSSAEEGGATKYSIQVQVADQIRAAVNKALNKE